ncbi:hypothetical protein [Streptomyces triticiradicis]|uniref:Transposase DDE domain-containing protein n=1 Tax=Streptomyces triticiradicis TaxID=2651189 RepID=A0A7J5D146_9ACTN|nr:hypothetical protein [Streptomyces triticiradicis]KAB1973204.1 hypothetical protein F8144_44135 [Streptomyces triticiradicis]
MLNSKIGHAPLKTGTQVDSAAAVVETSDSAAQQFVVDRQDGLPKPACRTCEVRQECTGTTEDRSRHLTLLPQLPVVR